LKFLLAAGVPLGPNGLITIRGRKSGMPRTVLMTAGWVINLAVAEYVIRRRPGHRSNRTPTGLGRPRTVDALAT